MTADSDTVDTEGLAPFPSATPPPPPPAGEPAGVLPADLAPFTAAPAAERRQPSPRAAAAAAGSGDDDEDGEGRGGGQQKISAGDAKKCARLALTFDAAPAEQRRVAAAALGLRGDPDAVSLVVAVASGDSRLARQAIGSVGSANVSDVPAAILVIGRLMEDREMLSRWWRIVAALGAVSSDQPRVLSQAAAQLTSGLASLSSDHRALLAATGEMLTWRR